MSRLTAEQLEALREVLRGGGDEPTDVEPLVRELQRQYEDAAPIGHGLAGARSLAIHRLIGGRVRREAGLVQQALRRVDAWVAEGEMPSTYAEAWRELLEGPVDALVAVLGDSGERASALRQCTPFVGVIDQETRLRVWCQERDRMASRA